MLTASASPWPWAQSTKPFGSGNSVVFHPQPFHEYAVPGTLAAVAATAASVPGTAYSWNGWGWNTTLFPDPKGFVDWAHGQGLALAVNIHPTINSNDPRYDATVAKT